VFGGKIALELAGGYEHILPEDDALLARGDHQRADRGQGEKGVSA